MEVLVGLSVSLELAALASQHTVHFISTSGFLQRELRDGLSDAFYLPTVGTSGEKGPTPSHERVPLPSSSNLGRASAPAGCEGQRKMSMIDRLQSHCIMCMGWADR